MKKSLTAGQIKALLRAAEKETVRTPQLEVAVQKLLVVLHGVETHLKRRAERESAEERHARKRKEGQDGQLRNAG